MEHDDIEQWIADNRARYLKLYGLEGWVIDIGVIDDPEATLMGECEACYEYRNAAISIYSEQINSKEELIETFCHELEHVLLSPFTAGFSLALPFIRKSNQEVLGEIMGFMEEQARNMIGQFRMNMLELQTTPPLAVEAREKQAQLRHISGVPHFFNPDGSLLNIEYALTGCVCGFPGNPPPPCTFHGS